MARTTRKLDNPLAIFATAAERRMIMIIIMTDNDYDKAIVWCKKKIENVKKYHILSGKRLEGYEEAMLCVMSYLHCEKERLVDND